MNQPALLVLNGKKAGRPDVREAVQALRGEGYSIEVRVTWEHGDLDRYVGEAIDRRLDRVIVGGGDGSVNEAVSAAMGRPGTLPTFGILPLGTANDFATACGIPGDPLPALRLAITGAARPVDAVAANERFFVNVASVGFGAAITANTPVALKNFLGGGAYTVSGLAQALNFEPYPSLARIPGREIEGQLLVGAVCNGRIAGGGQPLAPEALIDDGLLDVLVVNHFTATDLPAVIRELAEPGIDGEFIKRFRVPWIEGESDHEIPINLDGEPYATKKIRMAVVPGAIDLVVPPECPCLSENTR